MAWALIICITAIPNADIEILIGTEGDHPTVVIKLRVIKTQNFATTGGISNIWIRGIYPPLREHMLIT